MNEIEQHHVQDILTFWFGKNLTKTGELWPEKNITRQWFSGGQILDEIIMDRFSELVGKALTDELDHWQQQADSSLALVILLDQFTRNIFRGRLTAFSGDEKALSVSKYALEKGFNLQVKSYQRIFFYMPFEHAESMEEQNHAVTLFEQLALSHGAESQGADSENELADKLQNYVEHAREHRAIIHRFGRFPHRNQILERPSTPEEIDFLIEGKTFGQ